MLTTAKTTFGPSTRTSDGHKTFVPFVRRVLRCSVAILTLAGPFMTPARADDAPPFELPGPDLAITVTRGKVTLPIAQVPNLAQGDKIAIQADLPKQQGVHFLLVSAFLRGATNPPPDKWIDAARTWKDKEKDKALALTVPKGAEQMTLLLAPETGGAQGALSDAVRGKPGEFVRAGQELNQASLDHSRLETFMAGIRAQGDVHPEDLRKVAPTLAASLGIKLKEDCLSKVIDEQASCLLENDNAVVLGGVHSSSITDTLTGTPTDLALQLSATPQAGGGYYSSYIEVARDVARIFGAFNNPQFGYLPALTTRRGQTLSLLLNAAPSFKKPKSVMVAAMPAIQAEHTPQLRSLAKAPICAVQPGAVLPVEGAPLVFSTDFAHDMMVTVTGPSGRTVEVAVTPRADKGGYLIDGSTLPADFTGTLKARLHGMWGFTPFVGPDFQLQRPDGKDWQMPEGTSLVTGRDNTVILDGAAPACVDSVSLQRGDDAPRPLSWTLQGTGQLVIAVPKDAIGSGKLRLAIRTQGQNDTNTLTLTARAEASRIDGLELHAGDAEGMLTGQRLDQVTGVTIGGMSLQPAGLTRNGNVDRLRLVAPGSAQKPALTAGSSLEAHIQLAGGRSQSLAVRIASARPSAALISRSIRPAPVPSGALALGLGDADLLPNNGALVFSVQAASGHSFDASDKLEIRPAPASTDMANGRDASAPVTLSAGHGLTLASDQVIVAQLKGGDLPPSTFGPLQYRLVEGAASGNSASSWGRMSDWQPLATLVRLPGIESLTCHRISRKRAPRHPPLRQTAKRMASRAP